MTTRGCAASDIRAEEIGHELANAINSISLKIRLLGIQIERGEDHALLANRVQELRDEVSRLVSVQTALDVLACHG